MKFNLVIKCVLAAMALTSGDIIRGTVTDAVDGLPLEGVKVSLDQKHYTSSGADGAYELNTEVLAVKANRLHGAPELRWNSPTRAFTWSSLSGAISIEVRDMQGRQVWEQTFRNSGLADFQVPQEWRGMFMINIRAGSWNARYRVLCLDGGLVFAVRMDVADGRTGQNDGDGKPLAKSGAAHALSFEKIDYQTLTRTVEGSQDNVNIALQQTAIARDAAYWPFSSSSPWNTPIGSGAQYQAPPSPVWESVALKYGIIINDTFFTIPVSISKATDPLRKIYKGSTIAFEQRVSDLAKADPSSDAHFSIIDENHRYVTEMYKGKRRPDMDIEAGFPNKIDLRGPGIADTYIGSCAYGGSSIAGLIRKGELKNGIRHALRMSLTPEVLNKNAPGGKHFVWPANSADGDYQKSYTGTGNIFMGSLLAIPPNVNIDTLFTKGTPLYELAKALQDYGAYVVDRGFLNFYVDPEAAGESSGVEYNKVIGKYLKVVVNNGPNSVGGGGKPRRALAPAFK